MKAKPMALKRVVLQEKAAGKSFIVVAAEFGVPVGTVKTWWNRHRAEMTKPEPSGARQTNAVSPQGSAAHQWRIMNDETPVSVGEKGAYETLLRSPASSFEGHALCSPASSFEGQAPVSGGTGTGWHRGLRACHMPGRKDSKQMTFAMFKRGMWPPKVWKVPGHLVGGELLMMLEERCAVGGAPVGGKQSAVGGSESEPITAHRPLAAGPATFRGITRWDLPGKGLYEQSVNFRNLKKGTYPPKCWGIPGWLTGEGLIEAIWKANAAKGRKAGDREATREIRKTQRSEF